MDFDKIGGESQRKHSVGTVPGARPRWRFLNYFVKVDYRAFSKPVSER